LRRELCYCLVGDVQARLARLDTGVQELGVEGIGVHDEGDQLRLGGGSLLVSTVEFGGCIDGIDESRLRARTSSNQSQTNLSSASARTNARVLHCWD
jgi:hypothetical protein